MSTFVLVHGAWHEGSAWNEVIKTAKGHQVCFYDRRSWQRRE